MKLIKLSDTHYIVVDDSEIKELEYNTWFYDIKTKLVGQYFQGDVEDSWRKITHSTQPLEKIEGSEVWENGKFLGPDYAFQEIIPLSLSEVEEAINRYSFEEIADEWSTDINNVHPADSYIAKQGYLAGFKAHQELTKDKLFTVEQLNEAVAEAWNSSENNEDNETYTQVYKRIIQSLLPKTEWDVKFNEQGKIELA